MEANDLPNLQLAAMAWDSAPFGVALVDKGGRLRLFNRKLLELLSVPDGGLSDQPTEVELLTFLHQQGDFGIGVSLRDVLEGPYPTCNSSTEGAQTYTRTTRTGRTLEITTWPVSNGWVRTLFDLTHHVQNERFIQTLTSRAPGMLYQMHTSPDQWVSFPFASAGIAELFDLTPESVQHDGMALLRRIHPEDLPLLRDVAMSRETEAQNWKLTYRVVLPDGRRKWHETQALAQRQPDGSVDWYGYTHDITDRVKDNQDLSLLSQLLRNRTELLETTLDNLGHGVLYVDANGILAFYNPRAAQLLDIPERLLADQPPVVGVLHYMLHRGDFEGATSLADLVRQGWITDMQGSLKPGRLVRAAPSGRMLEVKTTQVPSGGWVRTLADVTEFIDAQRAARNSAQRMRALVDAIPDRVWFKDMQGFYLAANTSMAKTYNRTVTSMLGLDTGAINPSETVETDLATDAEAFALNGGLLRFETELPLNLRGDVAAFEVTKVAVFDEKQQALGVLGLARDLTERKQVEAQIQRMAFYDPLTRLCNRLLFEDRLSHAQMSSERSGTWAAVVFIDLDNFKDLNDTLGHGKGDQLLKQVAQRLLACVREQDTVARFGGDEFVILLTDLSPDEQPAALAANTVGQKILAALNIPYLLGSTTTYHSSGSVGVTLFKGGQDRYDDIMKRADLAMYHAKGLGRNALSFFDPDMQSVVSDRTRLDRDLREALSAHQLVLFYQPVVDRERHTVCYEALVRWQHPERGLVSPGVFIPLAEQSGLILPIGRWVLETACRQLVAWANQPDKQDICIAVNLSARQLRQKHFVDEVLAVVRDTGAQPHLLKLELTESLLLQDVEETIVKMEQLAKHGIRFSLDDFGTGYSSLAYLKRLPLSVLKIDQSFVRDLLIDENDRAIAGMILTLAKSLDLNVVAEGVELEDQMALLVDMGCQHFQGYLFGKPALV
jgi:diguanylate cyclase (GGDEF)-like protein/PAS domain S-box-containing protein